MNFILRLFLTFSAVSFFLIVFLIQNEINPFEDQLGEYAWLIYIAYVIAPFLFTIISLSICKLLTPSTINKVISLETSNKIGRSSCRERVQISVIEVCRNNKELRAQLY